MLKLISKRVVSHLSIFVALSIFSQSSIEAQEVPPPVPDPISESPKPSSKSSHDSVDPGSSKEGSLARYRDRYPKFNTVLTAFTNWSKQENEDVIGQISSEQWEKMAKWMAKVLEYRGTLDTDACSSKDLASDELRSALTFCFGAFDGENPAAVYRLVLALKQETVDANDVLGALREVELCKKTLKKMADGKRRKLGSRAERSPMDWELDLDNIQPLLTTLSTLKVAKPSASPSPTPTSSPSVRTRAEECIIYHGNCYQQRLDETPLDKMCLLGEKPVEQVSARPTPVTPESPAQPPPPQNPNVPQSVPPQPVPQQQPIPQQPIAQPVPQPVPQVGIPNYEPSPGYPSVPSMGGGYGYKRGGGGGVGGCGGCGGGGFVAGGGVVRGGGVAVGVGVGPRFPAPLPPPVPFPAPIPQPLMVMGGASVAVGGGFVPSVGGVAVSVSTTTVVSNAPIATQMPMNFAAMKTCMRGKCPPQMGGMRPPQVNPLMRGYPPPRPGFLQVSRPPMVVPQVSPYTNPTFYSQVPQYAPVTPDRGGIGRVAAKNS